MLVTVILIDDEYYDLEGLNMGIELYYNSHDKKYFLLIALLIMLAIPILKESIHMQHWQEPNYFFPKKMQLCVHRKSMYSVLYI